EAALLGRGDVGQEVRDLHRKPGTRRLELEVLTAPVLVPAPGLRLRVPERRVNVEMTVIEVDVPAEGALHSGKSHRVGDELDEALVEADEPQLVKRLAGPRQLAVDPVDRRGQARELRLRERAPKDCETVRLELGLHHVSHYDVAGGAGPS